MFGGCLSKCSSKLVAGFKSFGEVATRYQRGYKSRKSQMPYNILDNEHAVSNGKYVSQDLLEAERNSGSSVNQRRRQAGHVKTSKSVAGGTEIIFGISSISLAFEARRRKFHQLYVKELRPPHDNQRLIAIELHAKKLGVPVQKVEVKSLDELSNGRPHQGACLEASIMQFETEEDLRLDDETHNVASATEDNASRRGSKRLWILIDRIQDPMNMGAILRSCYYFGVDRILAVKTNTCRLTPVVSKASSGTAEILKVYQIDDSASFLKLKVESGWSVIGSASPDGVNSLPNERLRVDNLNSFIWPDKSVLLIGNEGDGVTSELLHLCTELVTIPLVQPLNKDIQSLNVSVATGVLLYSHFAQASKE